MKIKLVGKNLDDIRPLLGEFGMEEAKEGFELVIPHGGDGALLGAEREFPGIPKLPIRDEGTAPVCSEHRCRSRLADFIAGKTRISRLPMVAGEKGEEIIYGVNDVYLRNADHSCALRYRVRIDGELYADGVVGDGVCFSSVHGSTAYYRSITHSIFRVGVGLAFNNSTEAVNHLVLDSHSRVEIEVLRGPGVLLGDNGPEIIEATEGDRIQLYQSDRIAEFYGLDAFMCPRCRVLRHPNKHPFVGFP